MKKITIFLIGILLILCNVAKADTGDVTTTPFVPDANKVYRVFSYGQYNASSSTTTIRKYLTLNSTGSVVYTETLDAANYDMLWQIVQSSDGTTFTFKSFSQGLFLNSNGSNSPLLSSTSESFTLSNPVTFNSIPCYYFNNPTTAKGLELGTTQYTVFFKNAPGSSRARFEWGFQAVDIPAMTPSISLTTANSNQGVNINNPISDIVYKWNFSTSATINWTGTANSNTAPDGITVTTNTTTKNVTITGSPTTVGSYGFSITSTDGTTTSAPLTGTITAKSVGTLKMAYVTTVTNGQPAVLDAPFISRLSNDFGLTYISSVTTGVDFSIYDVIVQSSIPPSGDAGLAELKTKSLSKPFVNMKSFQLQASRWNWATPANTTSTTMIVPDALKTHPIYNGITFSGTNSNEVILTTATTGNMAVSTTAWVGSPTPAAPTALSTVKDPTTGLSAGLACYFEIPVGTTMSTGFQTSAKQIVLGLSEATYGLLTADAVTLAVNAAKYVVAPVPTISLTSGSNAQTLHANASIANVVYTYGGAVTATNVVWTGTANASTPPAGITVTVNAVAKTITISGAPTAEGVYGYTVSATDGAAVPALTGTITVSIGTGVQSTFNAKTVVTTEFFDVTGKKVSEYSHGLLIEKTIYSDGSVSFNKIYRAEF